MLGYSRVSTEPRVLDFEYVDITMAPSTLTLNSKYYSGIPGDTLRSFVLKVNGELTIEDDDYAEMTIYIENPRNILELSKTFFY